MLPMDCLPRGLGAVHTRMYKCPEDSDAIKIMLFSLSQFDFIFV